MKSFAPRNSIDAHRAPLHSFLLLIPRLLIIAFFILAGANSLASLGALNKYTVRQKMRLALILLLFVSVSAIAADPQQEFRDELTKLSEASKDLQPAQIYSVARTVFSTKSAANKARVDDWLASLAPFSGTDGYIEEKNMQHPVSLADADKSVSETGQSDRLFMQGVYAEDIVWLALDQTEGMNLRPEKQSQKLARVYVRPQIELVSREGAKVVIAIFDFDHLIQVTTIQTTSGVLLPVGYRILKK